MFLNVLQIFRVHSIPLSYYQIRIIAPFRFNLYLIYFLTLMFFYVIIFRLHTKEEVFHPIFVIENRANTLHRYKILSRNYNYRILFNFKVFLIYNTNI